MKSMLLMTDWWLCTMRYALLGMSGMVNVSHIVCCKWKRIVWVIIIATHLIPCNHTISYHINRFILCCTGFVYIHRLHNDERTHILFLVFFFNFCFFFYISLVKSSHWNSFERWTGQHFIPYQHLFTMHACLHASAIFH